MTDTDPNGLARVEDERVAWGGAGPRISRRVLLLDDDSDMLSALAEAIDVVFGLPTTAVHSIDEMHTRAAEALTCEAAILDLHLGSDSGTGLEALSWLRDQGFHGSISFLTGYARTHPLVVCALRRGDVAVYAKPIEIEQLGRMLGATAHCAER